MPSCPLCLTKNAKVFHEDRRLYYRCTNCKGIFVNTLPDSQEEEARYRTHNNDVEDPRYQKFVMPIVNHIFSHFKPAHSGLDYGAGPGPVITKLLRDQGYNVKVYDPFFADNKEVLITQYDYIICCEVIEHFHHPAEEFNRLFGLLKPGGQLICMTALYNDEIDFSNWFYKNDITHVFFYSKETLEFIKKEFGFSELNIDGRLIVWER